MPRAHQSKLWHPNKTRRRKAHLTFKLPWKIWLNQNTYKKTPNLKKGTSVFTTLSLENTNIYHSFLHGYRKKKNKNQTGFLGKLSDDGIWDKDLCLLSPGRMQLGDKHMKAIFHYNILIFLQNFCCWTAIPLRQISFCLSSHGDLEKSEQN